MKALVTGATGFVGSAVLRRLLDRGAEARTLARPNSDRRNLDGLDVDIVEGDLNDRVSLIQALEGCDALFHVAADYRLWTREPHAMFAVNVDGTRSIMMAAMETGVKRIVYTSSVATLGIIPDQTPADEDTPVSFSDMVGPYKQSKFLAEEEVRRLVREEGLPAVIVNPSTPIGPRDVKPTPTGRMVVEAATGRMPAFVDTGLNVVHVDDVADGHLLAFDKGTAGERYVLGAENLSLRDILHRIAAITGNKPPKIRLPHGMVLPIAYAAEGWSWLTRGGEPFVTVDGIKLAKKFMYFSHAKAKRDLGYSPRPAFDALKDAIEWFEANGYNG